MRKTIYVHDALYKASMEAYKRSKPHAGDSDQNFSLLVQIALKEWLLHEDYAAAVVLDMTPDERMQAAIEHVREHG